MKPDSVARFEINKTLINKTLMDEFAMVALYGLLLKDRGLVDSHKQAANAAYKYAEAMLQARGLVHPEPESKKDTIEIDRAVAERWIKMADDVSYHNDRELVFEIKEALAEGGSE